MLQIWNIWQVAVSAQCCKHKQQRQSLLNHILETREDKKLYIICTCIHVLLKHVQYIWHIHVNVLANNEIVNILCKLTITTGKLVFHYLVIFFICSYMYFRIMNIIIKSFGKWKLQTLNLLMYERCCTVKSFKWYILYMSLVYLFSLTLS